MKDERSNHGDTKFFKFGENFLLVIIYLSNSLHVIIVNQVHGQNNIILLLDQRIDHTVGVINFGS